jgi:hypothetical protein
VACGTTRNETALGKAFSTGSAPSFYKQDQLAAAVGVLLGSIRCELFLLRSGTTWVPRGRGVLVVKGRYHATSESVSGQ